MPWSPFNCGHCKHCLDSRATAHKEVLLAGQPTPTPRRVQPSSPSLQQRSCAFSDHKDSEPVQVLAQLLTWRGPVRALCSARAKEIENYCPQKCCPIIGFIWFEKGSRILSTLFEYRSLQTCWELLFCFRISRDFPINLFLE